MRLAAIAALGAARPGFGDAGPYLFAAGEIAQHGRYPDRTEAYFFRAPGYPLFLAAATLGRPDRTALAKSENAVLGAVAALLLALLSARIFRRRAMAVATGLVAAVFPSLVVVSVGIQSEPLFLVLLLAAGLGLLAAADRSSLAAACGAGAALGLAALTRPSALALAPLLAAPAFDRSAPSRAGRRLAAGAVLSFLAVLAPWTVRNALRFHEFIPVSDAAGVSLYAGNSAWTRSFYAIRSRAEFARWLDAFDRDLKARLGRLEAAGETTPARRSSGFARMALAEARADPAGTLRLLGVKAWQWVKPYPTPWFWPPAVVVGIGLLYAALDVLAAHGLLRASRRGVAVACLAVLAVSMAAHVLLEVVWRYRVPYWDPILLLYGVAGAAPR